MLKIHYSPTFKKIREFANNYNEQFIKTKESNYTGTNCHSKKKLDPDIEKKKINSISSMLRRPHIQLMEKLAICLSQQIGLDQKIYGVVSYSIKEDDLPWLRTNNCALATILECTPRTIYMQLKRLENCGFIQNRTYHGTRSDYKLKLNSSCLYLVNKDMPVLMPLSESSQTDPSETPDIPRNETQNRGFTDEGLKEFPLNDKGTIKINNNKLSGEIVENTISSLSSKFKGTKTEQGNSSESSKEKSKKISLKGSSGTDKNAPPVAADPPSLDDLDPEVRKYGQLLINFMYGTLFSRLHYHAPNQINYSRQFLRDQLCGLEGRELKAKFNELKERIQLVWDWMQRDSDRYIPIPSKYLDPTNPGGFSRTKLWHDKMKDNRIKLKESHERTMEFYGRWEALNKVLNRYLMDQNTDAYKRAKKYLEKNNPEICDAFDIMVINKFVA